jgi:hypothetical protein
MARKTMTAEQVLRYEERRADMRAIAKKIAAMTAEARTALAAQRGLVRTCEHRVLSAFNTCLLILQREDVTIVGGFQQWRRLGRQVKKGEKGCYMWIPLGSRGEAGTGEGAGDRQFPDERRFRLVAVFDVAQTEEDGSYVSGD